MQISQIYISDSGNLLPPYLAECMNILKVGFPDYDHVLYDKNSLRQFIAENFDIELLNAYDSLIPYAYKADLGRYCLLYKLGGWYFDISLRLLNTLRVNNDIQSIAFRDMQYFSRTSFACSNTILYAKKEDPVFFRAIDVVLKNCREKYYGISSLCPTGPNVLGRAFALEGANRLRIFGEHLLLTPYHQLKNGAFIMPDGLILGLKKTASKGGLAMLGAEGTNDYNQLYLSGMVYK